MYHICEKSETCTQFSSEIPQGRPKRGEFFKWFRMYLPKVLEFLTRFKTGKSKAVLQHTYGGAGGGKV
jgi:hypothetical protein